MEVHWGALILFYLDFDWDFRSFYINIGNSYDCELLREILL